MATVTVRFLGGMKAPPGEPSIEVALPDGSTVAELRDRLRGLGYDPTSTAIIVTLNGRGLRQWPADRPIGPADEVAVFQRIAGG